MLADIGRARRAAGTRSDGPARHDRPDGGALRREVLDCPKVPGRPPFSTRQRAGGEPELGLHCTAPASRRPPPPAVLPPETPKAFFFSPAPDSTFTAASKAPAHCSDSVRSAEYSPCSSSRTHGEGRAVGRSGHRSSATRAIRADMRRVHRGEGGLRHTIGQEASVEWPRAAPTEEAERAKQINDLNNSPRGQMPALLLHCC